MARENHQKPTDLRFLLGIRFPDVQKKTSGSKNPAVFSVFPGTGNIPPLRHVHQLAQLALCESPKVAVSLVFWVAELFGNGPGSPVVIGPKNWSEVIWKRKRTVEILTGWCFQPIFGMIIPNIGEKTCSKPPTS